jgi:dipeptidyl aminopeptidase/acylaminoacyl peptidase
MTQTKTVPYGSWRSPITPALAASGAVGLEQIWLSGEDVYWLEGRPLEGGRRVIVRRRADGAVEDVTPPDIGVQTRVHEYGGGDYLVDGETVTFSNRDDQRLYRQDPGQAPYPITPEPAIPAGLRYADGRVTPDGRWLICVRERHQEQGEAINELVALPPDGSEAPRAIASGHDFYASPRISPDGRTLAWLTWDHPQMPWDGTELWAAPLLEDGSLGEARLVAGSVGESIFQPEWSPDGVLYFASDRTGWWNLYAERDGDLVPIMPMEAEFAGAQWVFNLSAMAFLADGQIAAIYHQDGFGHLALIDPAVGQMEALEVGFTSFSPLSLRANAGGDRLYFIGGTSADAPAVVELALDTGHIQLLRKGMELEIDPGYLSIPHAITFPTEGDLDAYAFFYPPANQDYAPPVDERPPLIVISHGGPTGATRVYLSLGIQYWTSRGFAVVDVNYGGSTGYGRAYRERLDGAWGIVDTADCVNAAKYLAEQGLVDGERLLIRGGSAGGYTTLCALTFYDIFSAGASYYGVGDLETLARDTHKFESRYLDSMVGPYPEAQAIYHARSPIHFTDRLSCPVILFQGLDDKVVPPSQAEMMVDALRAKGLPFAYIAFEGEAHGFRKAENIQRALEAELYFYARVFGFELADPVAPVTIENL